MQTRMRLTALKAALHNFCLFLAATYLPKRALEDTLKIPSSCHARIRTRKKHLYQNPCQEHSGNKFSTKQQGTAVDRHCRAASAFLLLMYLAICVFSFTSRTLKIAFESEVKRLNWESHHPHLSVGSFINTISANPILTQGHNHSSSLSLPLCFLLTSLLYSPSTRCCSSFFLLLLMQFQRGSIIAVVVLVSFCHIFLCTLGAVTSVLLPECHDNQFTFSPPSLSLSPPLPSLLPPPLSPSLSCSPSVYLSTITVVAWRYLEWIPQDLVKWPQHTFARTHTYKDTFVFACLAD